MNRWGVLAGIFVVLGAGCGGKDDVHEEFSSANCYQGSTTQVVAGARGAAQVFYPDPMSSSEDLFLSPSDDNLDAQRKSVELNNLNGVGILKGLYADVRNHLYCGGGYGVHSDQQNFEYKQADTGFAEAMSYYYTDKYREYLDSIGVLVNLGPLQVYAHCKERDNAFYIRNSSIAGQGGELVCFGDSDYSKGASYSDDAYVIIHEVQHGSTSNTYSESNSLGGQFYGYDEAGALNEGISDFAAMMYFSDSQKLDPLVFSRWALGAFIEGFSSVRGAHLCPEYDSRFPNCTNYQPSAAGFSTLSRTISYVYPDGVGWPMPNNFSSVSTIKNVFNTFPVQEEIHNVGVLISGALWDVYANLINAGGGSASGARDKSLKLLHTALRLLPQPTLSRPSPVNFVEMAKALVSAADIEAFSVEEKDAVVTALENRGLTNFTPVTPNWASVGPGVSPNPGLFILDRSADLRGWIGNLYQNPGIADSINGKLDAEETVALWIDLQNLSSQTAGAVTLKVEILDDSVEFLDERVNGGYQNPQTAFIQYYKVNGTSIVTHLSDGSSVDVPPVGNNYFDTNPFYFKSPRTALFLKALPAAAGKNIILRVTASPSNGPTETVNFTLKVNAS